MTRALVLPKFRAAVTLDPAHCAGLVALELVGMDPSVVRKTLRENRARNGRTESYAGFFDIPKKLPGSCLSPMRRLSLPLPMLTDWQTRLKPPHGRST